MNMEREYHHAKIDNLHKVKATLRAGQWSWPGGYPLYFHTQCGCALCFDCVKEEFKQVVYDFLNDCSTGWRIEGCAINHEDLEMRCDQCSGEIQSAIGEY
jgi:hypothetical protein